MQHFFLKRQGQHNLNATLTLRSIMGNCFHIELLFLIFTYRLIDNICMYKKTWVLLDKVIPEVPVHLSL